MQLGLRNFVWICNETSGNNTVLIIDCSGSMRNNDPMINGTCGRIEAAKGFVNVSGSNDYIAIIAEDSQAKLLCDFVKADEKECSMKQSVKYIQQAETIL